MDVIRVVSLKNQKVIADKCTVAVCFWERCRGLIGRKGFASGEGVWFPQCNSIHMWFMKIAIDVVFLKPEPQSVDVWRVVRCVSGVRPWRLWPLSSWQAEATLELPEGTIVRMELLAGDRVCLS